MKKLLILVGSAILFTLLLNTNSIRVNAESAKELKDCWYETKDYPSGWKLYDLTHAVDILNPPDEVLMEFTSYELAELLLRYPYINNFYGYDEPQFYFDFLYNSCAIYKELFARDDGVHELLNAFRDNVMDIEAINNDATGGIIGHYGTEKEYFVCRYMDFFWDSIPDAEKEYYNSIAEEKQVTYQSVTEKVRGWLLYVLSFSLDEELRVELLYNPEEDAEEANGDTTEEITNDVGNVDERLIRTEGFVDSGIDYIQTMEGIQISYNEGRYYIHGTSASCRQWYSGVFTDEIKYRLNLDIVSANPTWVNVYEASPKYNCHSYAWIVWGPQNGYWLPSPTDYCENATDYLYEGTYITERLDLHENDIIVIYNAASVPVHSMIVIDPDYQGTMITESKNGRQGVYRVKYSDMMQYYSGVTYKVYRCRGS